MVDAFADFIFDDLAEPDLPWIEEPKDRGADSEELRQRQLLNRLRSVAPGITAWAVPNAARRTRWEAAKAKREGMRAGALDLTLAWNRGVAFIEMKDGRGQPTPQQREMLNALFRAGHHCGVFRTADAAVAWLRDIGAPIREIRT